MKLFWPEICPFCGRAFHQGICFRCRKKLKTLEISEPKCMKCGKPIRHEEQEYCQDCARARHCFEKGIALWLHKEPINLSIYQYKFHNQRRFGQYYAEEMAKRYGAILKKWNPDIIIPIPLHWSKLRKRGYNQSAIIAEKLGEHMGIPASVKLLKRIRRTSPLKALDPAQRKKSLEKAFAVADDEGKLLEGKIVLLIDDIYTTGSTMDEAAKTLKRAGAEKVFYLTISIGQGY